MCNYFFTKVHWLFAMDFWSPRIWTSCLIRPLKIEKFILIFILYFTCFDKPMSLFWETRLCLDLVGWMHEWVVHLNFKKNSRKSIWKQSYNLVTLVVEWCGVAHDISIDLVFFHGNITNVRFNSTIQFTTGP